MIIILPFVYNIHLEIVCIACVKICQCTKAIKMDDVNGGNERIWLKIHTDVDRGERFQRNYYTFFLISFQMRAHYIECTKCNYKELFVFIFVIAAEWLSYSIYSFDSVAHKKLASKS